MEYDPDEKYLNPDWVLTGHKHVHEWRCYVTDEVKAMWPSFTPEQRAAIGRMAQAAADQEHWD
jgi:hypothetical protein